MTLALAPEAQDLLFRHARTANAFTGEAVSDEQIAGIYDLVKWARRPREARQPDERRQQGQDRRRSPGRDPRR
jgi:hypothetical protein